MFTQLQIRATFFFFLNRDDLNERSKNPQNGAKRPGYLFPKLELSQVLIKGL